MILAMSQFEMAVVFFCCVLFLLFVIWLIWQSAADGPNDKRSSRREEQTVPDTPESPPVPAPKATAIQQEKPPSFRSGGRTTFQIFLVVIIGLSFLVSFVSAFERDSYYGDPLRHYNDSIWKEIAGLLQSNLGTLNWLFVLGLGVILILSFIEERLAEILHVLKHQRRD